jgi:hypothetical protein
VEFIHQNWLNEHKAKAERLEVEAMLMDVCGKLAAPHGQAGDDEEGDGDRATTSAQASHEAIEACKACNLHICLLTLPLPVVASSIAWSP